MCLAEIFLCMFACIAVTFLITLVVTSLNEVVKVSFVLIYTERDPVTAARDQSAGHRCHARGANSSAGDRRPEL